MIVELSQAVMVVCYEFKQRLVKQKWLMHGYISTFIPQNTQLSLSLKNPRNGQFNINLEGNFNFH